MAMVRAPRSLGERGEHSGRQFKLWCKSHIDVCTMVVALVCCLPIVWGTGVPCGCAVAAPWQPTEDTRNVQQHAAERGRLQPYGGPPRWGERQPRVQQGSAEVLGLHAGVGAGFPDVSRRSEPFEATRKKSMLRLRGGSTWGATWGSNSFGSSKKAHNPENDPEVDLEHCPNDGITDLRFSPKALLPKNYLAATTWEGEVRCYEVDPASGKTTPVGMQRHEKPAMCCAWKSDGSAIYSGGADGKGMMWHLATNTWTQIAQHDAPISGIFYSETPSPCVITCSWDRTVKFWDASAAPSVRQSPAPTTPSPPTLALSLPTPCHALSCTLRASPFSAPLPPSLHTSVCIMY